PPAFGDLARVQGDDRRRRRGWVPRRPGGAPVDHGLRRARLAERLGEPELEALIVTRLPNVRYLTGFTGANAQLGVAGGAAGGCRTDARCGAQSSHEVPDLPRTVYRQDYPQPLVDACRT